MLLTILGLVATIVFGVLGILYVLKYREKVNLTFFEEDIIPLFQSIVKNMDGLEILYERHPINPSLILLKGCFLNTGNRDIDKSIIHEPITIHLPEDNKWLKAKIISTSPNTQVNCSIKTDNSLQFEWDLLKKNEFVKFDAMFNMSSTNNIDVKDIRNLISLTQRITNLDKIEMEKIPVIKNKRRINRFLIVGLMYTLMGLFLTVYGSYKPHKQINYMIQLEDGQKIEVSATPTKNNMLKVESEKNNFSQQLEVVEFSKKYAPEPIIATPKFKYLMNLLSGSLVLLMGLLLFSYILITKRREKKFLKLFSSGNL